MITFRIEFETSGRLEKMTKRVKAHQKQRIELIEREL